MAAPIPAPIPLRNLPKHDRYRSAYRRFGYFWGLGVEHETYIMTSKSRSIKTFEGALRPERYCVNYYAAYKPDLLKAALAEVVPVTVPILLNGHSLTKCDINGEHATTYERVPKRNPKFTGKALFDWMCEYSHWMRTELNQTFMWDGDTIEFMTQRFYRATIDEVMNELQEGEDRFVYELSRLPAKGVIASYGPLSLANPTNEPWAIYLTNPRNISMFNNGTIHINVTLPTQLGWNRKPMWPADFREKHRRLARLVQWMEPLWIAAHGSADPFARLSPNFAAGSQRLAVSRYIGVGTFDTDTMPAGKILQVYKTPLPWYDAERAYESLDVIGLDINYNKHWSHGLELRFLDQLPMDSLRSVMKQVVVLMDIALEGREISDPRGSAAWIAAARSAIYTGSEWSVQPIELNAMAVALGITEDKKEPATVDEALTWIFDRLSPRRGFCWRKMVEPTGSSCLP